MAVRPAFVWEDEDHDIIYVALDPSIPEHHEVGFVHEVLHAVLHREGYPQVSIDRSRAGRFVEDDLQPLLDELQSYLASMLTHPEVYRRMRDDFQLDMAQYQAG